MSSDLYSRRDFLQTTALGASAVLAGQWLNCAGNRVSKPNIIYILADDLGYGDLGCYGQQKINTPHLDRLAAEGMRFTQHYAGSTVCAPSRCSLMTGMHTGHCEIRGNKEIQPEGQYPISAAAVTVAECLKEAGYVTGSFGKWGLGPPASEGDPNMQGFDYFFGYNCQRQAHRYYPDHLWRNQEKVLLPENAEGNRQTYSHDLIAAEAIQFIRRNKDRPFFLYVPFTIPHAELLVPEDSLAAYRGRFPETPYPPGRHYAAQEMPLAAYAAMVSRMDRDIGRLMETLKELGLEENTVVLFSSDNGPHREGGSNPAFFQSAGPFRGVKRDLYEGGIRVPLIARWPSKIKAGTVSGHVSAFWDFLPTACEIGGASPPAANDGISFLPTLIGHVQPQHEYLYWEFHEQGGKQAVRTDGWKAVRLQVRRNPPGPLELYNLREDIHEDHNVADQHSDIVDKMAAIMQAAHTESAIFPFKQG